MSNYYYTVTDPSFQMTPVYFTTPEETPEITPTPLPDLLKDHIGEKFYSPCYGEVILEEVTPEKLVISSGTNQKKHTLGKDGKHYSRAENTGLMIFPDYSSYLRNPRGEGVWEIWVSVKKTNFRALTMGNYYYVSFQGRIVESIETNSDFDLQLWKSGNYFETWEEASKASKAMKETLAKFH